MWKHLVASIYPTILCPDPWNGNLPPDKAITADGNDDEYTGLFDHLAASQTSAPNSTASDILLSNSIQAVANASKAGAGSKQSSLSAFFTKSSEKVSFLLQQAFLYNYLCHGPLSLSMSVFLILKSPCCSGKGYKC